MNAQPLLSICIATRNRGAYLERALTRLSAIGGGDIEIVVVDGASADDTARVLRVAATRDSRLRYETLAVNGGLDRDFNKAVENATGRFVWLCSDDDDILPGAMDRVRSALADHPSLVVVDAVVMSADLQEVLTHSRLRLEAPVRVAPGDAETLMRLSGQHLSFIGGVVMDRALWLARERDSYFGTYFVHFGVIFQAPLPAHATLLEAPCIAIRYGNASWTARSFEIWMWLWPRLVWSMPGVSERAMQAVCDQHPWRSWRHLVLFRAKGAFGIQELKRLQTLVRLGWADRLRATGIALIPGQLINALAILAAHLGGPTRRQALVDFRDSKYHVSRWLR